MTEHHHPSEPPVAATAQAGTWTRLREDFIRWVTRRHRVDGRQTQITRDRVYILPTRHGYLLVAILIVMLLGAINYSNNMAFLLTFLIVGIGHNTMWYTHRNLLGLKLTLLPIEPVFAGQKPRLRLRLDTTTGRAREALQLSIGSLHSRLGAVDAMGQGQLELVLAPMERGIYRLPRQRLATRYPLGLLEAWTWLTLDTEVVVYPQPADRADSMATASGASQADADVTQGHDSDPDHLRDYRPGDSPRKMLWKAVARSGRLIVREHSTQQVESDWLDWDAVPGHDIESRLALLCRWILDRQTAQQPYGLRMPGVEIAPGLGPDHLARCLYPLAGFARGEPAPITTIA